MSTSDTQPTDGRVESERPRILFISEAHLHRDGKRWLATDGVNGDTQWGRYNLPGCRVSLAARASSSSSHALTGDATGHGSGDPVTVVEVCPLRDYQGVKAAALSLPVIAVQIFRAVRETDLVVARTPGPLSMLAVVSARITRTPYAVEVVGDIYDVLVQGTIPGAERLAGLGRKLTAWACRSARAGRYVTQQTLQESYPVGTGEMIGISNVQISPDIRAAHPRTLPQAKEGRSNVNLLIVGSQEAPYKGHDVALEALAQLRAATSTHNFHLTIVGGGKLHETLVERATSLGLEEAARFTGALPPEGVHEEMERADLLLQPSLTEGLPRVVVEAMAHGLPVCGSNIGGIPELVSPEFLVPPGDPHALAEAVGRLVAPATYAAESKRSLEASSDYLLPELNSRFADWSATITNLARESRH